MLHISHINKMDLMKIKNCASCNVEIEYRKRFCTTCLIRKRKKRQKEYNQRPEVKEYARLYYQHIYYKIPGKRIQRNDVMKTWQKKNKSAWRKIMSKYMRKRRFNDKSFAIKDRIITSLWIAFKKYSQTGKIMSSKKYGINFIEIIEHLKPFPKDMENYHIDHIIPLSRFNFNNPEHIRIAFRPENHQWLTIKENLEKGNRLIMPH